MTKTSSALLPDFEDISYLNEGSSIQREGHFFLSNSKILYHLKHYRPVLAGTLPLDLFIQGKSDLDILLHSDDFNSVEKILQEKFSGYSDFAIMRKPIGRVETLICRFHGSLFPVEIFCQPVQIHRQVAYRHLIIEFWLLSKFGRDLRSSVMTLKCEGWKTEPAFAKALDLHGNPYDAILNFENDADFIAFARTTP